MTKLEILKDCTGEHATINELFECKSCAVLFTNLFDYVAENYKWEQLWADNDIVVWFEGVGSKQHPYEVFTATRNALFNNGVMVICQSHCKDLTQALNVWNGLINKHIKESIN